WKTMEISLPRISSQERSDSSRRSRPRRRTCPVTRAPSGERLINARPSSVLPQPLSPTIASDSPAASSKLTPATAGLHCPIIGSSTLKSRTERRESITRSLSIFPHRLQLADLLRDVAVVGVQAVNLQEGPVGKVEIPGGLIDGGQVVEKADGFRFLDARS